MPVVTAMSRNCCGREGLVLVLVALELGNDHGQAGAGAVQEAVAGLLADRFPLRLVRAGGPAGLARGPSFIAPQATVERGIPTALAVLVTLPRFSSSVARARALSVSDHLDMKPV